MSETDHSPFDVLSVPATTHGRVLVRAARAGQARGLLVGFHGYGETAAIQIQRLVAIPGAEAWTLVSAQALHRFYDRRSGRVIACWMTHEDREQAIADNLAYVSAVLASVPRDPGAPVVFAGFSQGVAMAYRAACRGPAGCVGIIAVGGDVPPELAADPAIVFPPVLVVRGRTDEWYAAAKFEDDRAVLAAHGATVTAVTAACGHEWDAEVNELAGTFLAGVLELP